METISLMLIMGLGILLLVLLVFGLVLQQKKIFVFGKPSIRPDLFFIAKFSLILTLLALLLQAFSVNLRWVSPYPQWANILTVILFCISFIVFILSFFHLGNSLRVGLPDGETELRIGGLYYVSRNPMYVGMYIMLLSAVFYTLNPLVLITTILTIIIHHKIILAEEKYLEAKFGDEYERYRKHVKRYL